MRQDGGLNGRAPGNRGPNVAGKDPQTIAFGHDRDCMLAKGNAGSGQRHAPCSPG